MNLSFTPQQQIDALTKLGYEVKDETVMVEDRYSDEHPHKVYNVYLHGDLQIEWGALGTYRLTYVFEREMERKLLSLF
jgi:hypothetical protein